MFAAIHLIVIYDDRKAVINIIMATSSLEYDGIFNNNRYRFKIY